MRIEDLTLVRVVQTDLVTRIVNSPENPEDLHGKEVNAVPFEGLPNIRIGAGEVIACGYKISRYPTEVANVPSVLTEIRKLKPYGANAYEMGDIIWDDSEPGIKPDVFIPLKFYRIVSMIEES